VVSPGARVSRGRSFAPGSFAPRFFGRRFFAARSCRSRNNASMESTITRCEPQRVRTVRSRPWRIR